MLFRSTVSSCQSLSLENVRPFSLVIFTLCSLSCCQWKPQCHSSSVSCNLVLGLASVLLVSLLGSPLVLLETLVFGGPRNSPAYSLVWYGTISTVLLSSLSHGLYLQILILIFAEVCSPTVSLWIICGLPLFISHNVRCWGYMVSRTAWNMTTRGPDR